MKRLHVVVASTRPRRVGPAVGEWFAARAREHGGFDVHLVDLVDVALPLLDEPEEPSTGRYVHEHTRRWSASVEAADAFVFVAPEYNAAIAPSLLNALDCLYTEWFYKPVGFVAYGGSSAGLRAVQMTKQVVAALRMYPTVEQVPIHHVSEHLDEDGSFRPADHLPAAATAMLDELVRTADALAPLRHGRG